MTLARMVPKTRIAQRLNFDPYCLLRSCPKSVEEVIGDAEIIKQGQPPIIDMKPAAVPVCIPQELIGSTNEPSMAKLRI